MCPRGTIGDGLAELLSLCGLTVGPKNCEVVWVGKPLDGMASRRFGGKLLSSFTRSLVVLGSSSCCSARCRVVCCLGRRRVVRAVLGCFCARFWCFARSPVVASLGVFGRVWVGPCAALLGVVLHRAVVVRGSDLVGIPLLSVRRCCLLLLVLQKVCQVPRADCLALLANASAADELSFHGAHALVRKGLCGKVGMLWYCSSVACRTTRPTTHELVCGRVLSVFLSCGSCAYLWSHSKGCLVG